MKTIGIIINKLEGGGAERVASNLSIELSKYYRVVLIVFNGSNIAYPYKGELIDLKTIEEKNMFFKTYNLFKRVNLTTKIKHQYKIDVTISLLNTPNLVNMLSISQSKTIISVRNILSSVKLSFIKLNYIKFSSMFADRIIALSELVKLDLVKNFDFDEKKITTIYNSCDTKPLLDLETKYDIEELFNDDYKYIVNMGRLTKQKGQWHLIRAFNEALKENKNLKLVILGKGELELELKKLIKDYGIEDNVIMLGYIENPHQLISKCDIFVFSSIYEGLGNALLEALSLGLPVISTDCNAGPREILAPKTKVDYKTLELECAEYGILVPSDDYGRFNPYEDLSRSELELKNAINLLVSNKDMYNHFKQQALLRSKDFNPDTITSQWINVIEECITHTEV